MPTYEYECKTCGSVFDVFQSIKARALSKYACPVCEKVRAVQRRIGSGGAVLFKGSGFYTTDYRGENYKKAAKAESDSSKPATASESATSDASKSSSDKSTAKATSADQPAARSSKSSKKV